MGVGLRLKEILRERNMTIKQLANISGVSINTLYSITKRDSERVDEVILRKLADTLGVSFSYLAGFSSKDDIPLGIIPASQEERSNLQALTHFLELFYLKDYSDFRNIENITSSPTSDNTAHKLLFESGNLLNEDTITLIHYFSGLTDSQQRYIMAYLKFLLDNPDKLPNKETPPEE